MKRKTPVDRHCSWRWPSDSAAATWRTLQRHYPDAEPLIRSARVLWGLTPHAAPAPGSAVEDLQEYLQAYCPAGAHPQRPAAGPGAPRGAAPPVPAAAAARPPRAGSLARPTSRSWPLPGRPGRAGAHPAGHLDGADRASTRPGSSGIDAQLPTAWSRSPRRWRGAGPTGRRRDRRGRRRGPLRIPYGAKDLLAVPGYPNHLGQQLLSRPGASADTATAVRRPEDAGAVLVAKLTLGELAWGDVWLSAARPGNPWNPKEGSSGSSAGPGVGRAWPGGLRPSAPRRGVPSSRRARAAA